MVSSDYYIVDNSDLENKRLEAAKSHYRKGDYASALRLYLDMLNASISYKLYYEIGRCYYKLNDMLPAEEYFKKSIGLESFKNPSYLEKMQELFKDGVVDPFEDDVLKELVTNSKLLGDLEL